MNEQSMPCPYCGGHGKHIWAGDGACPGSVENKPDKPFQGSLTIIWEEEKQTILNRLSKLEEEMLTLKKQ